MNETRYGEIATDRNGVRWVQVFEYENGECVDRYVTRADAVPAADNPLRGLINAFDTERRRIEASARTRITADES